MKLYFMIGLPTEEDEDVLGIVETAARVQAIGREHQRGRAGDGVGVDPRAQAAHAVPVGGDGRRGRRSRASRRCWPTRARALRVTLKMHENHQSHIEGIFSRGDRRVADVLEAAFRLGCRFDGWDDALARRAVGPGDRRDRGAHRRRRATVTWARSRSRRGCPGTTSTSASSRTSCSKEYRKALKDRLSPPVRQAVQEAAAPEQRRRRRGGAPARSWSATTAASPAIWTR